MGELNFGYASASKTHYSSMIYIKNCPVLYTACLLEKLSRKSRKQEKFTKITKIMRKSRKL